MSQFESRFPFRPHHGGDPGPDPWLLQTVFTLPEVERLKAIQVLLDTHAAVLRQHADAHKQLSGIVAQAVQRASGGG